MYAYVSKTIDQWHNGEVKANDQFNTTWNQAYKEGKISGLKEFIDVLEKEALDD